MATWVLTGSPGNFAVLRERGFDVVGCKERRRLMAQRIQPGDAIVFYVTKVKAFGGRVRVTGEMFESREKLFAKLEDDYPWRIPVEPEVVLDEEDWVPAEALVDALEHCQKWPREHWTLAFQGQLRTVSDADAEVLDSALAEASGAVAR